MTELSSQLARVAPRGVTWAGLREVREVTRSAFVRDGRPELSSTRDSCGVLCEVLIDGAFGYAATAARDDAGRRAAMERAAAHARASAPHAVHRFDERARPPARGSYRSPGVARRDVDASVFSWLVALSRRLKAGPAILRTTAGVRAVDVTSRLVSTSGADVTQETFHLSTDLSATAARDGLVQKRSDAGPLGRSHQLGAEALDDPAFEARAARVGEEALALLDADPCPSDVRTLLLAPDQMMLQIHESIGHPLEIDRILGDERNYAGTSFVQLSDVGVLQYGSELLTVTFDPTVAVEHASYAFDDVGGAATRELVIDRGRLVRLLGGVESQARSGAPGVASQRASSWNRAAIDRMANLNVEPGTSTERELIAGVERGVYMEANRSWSIDDRRENFQFGCELGRLIVDGELGPIVRDPNYRGRALEFWRNLSGVGDRETFGVFGTPYCGKGEPNQVIRVGHASPVCRFERVSVFGGAS